MYDNDTEEHRALNRRTDVSFKIIEWFIRREL
jgi:flagellar motor protein MotB